MSKSKWTNEEENILTEMVESYLHKKKTKKEAFDVVANILNRSSSACRARYLKIERLKAKETVIKNETIQIPQSTTSHDQSFTLEDVISYLKKYKTNDYYEQKNHKLRCFFASLEKENEGIKERYQLALSKIKETKDLFLEGPFVNTYNEK
ncbi:hypothetical protein J5Y03_01310 [Bacillus sp. RG28]|uniref:Myb-like domain-containing protein n=1 Tax=Gottfriedia endophytica TaxID=2820819 RepID=A0A940NLU7_9BACI|nr:Myb-like DNA-binding domain-containing protein [Gottfriedia endophytica]MBP0723818.1 hypothetical protein [Gottfriedia endophytica]